MKDYDHLLRHGVRAHMRVSEVTQKADSFGEPEWSAKLSSFDFAATIDLRVSGVGTYGMKRFAIGTNFTLDLRETTGASKLLDEQEFMTPAEKAVAAIAIFTADSDPLGESDEAIRADGQGEPETTEAGA